MAVGEESEGRHVRDEHEYEGCVVKRLTAAEISVVVASS